jgi:hypothetical protein
MIPQSVRDQIKKRFDARIFDDSQTPETFMLHVADCGGYDICSDVTLEFVGEQVFMIFRTRNHGERDTEEARFELRFV